MANTHPRFVVRNGALIPAAQASVSVFTPALYGAYGVYESLQVARGVVFAQQAHLERLARSAAIVGLALPADLATLGGWLAQALAANAVTAGTLRLFVVGAEDGAEATVYLWPEAPAVYPEAFYTHGAPVITCEGRRFLPEAKSLNTLVSYLARRQARAAGVHEALLHHDGNLTEGSNSNLFAVVDGVLVTPPAEQVLSGVTRDLALALAAADGIPQHAAPLALADLPRWREAFITSTSRHIMPITLVDGRPVGDGMVGPLTRRLMALFETYFRSQVDG